MDNKFLELINESKSLDILYVEDDENTLKTISELFKSFFNKVDLAKDGEEALIKYQNNNYDLVITDLKMPKLSGVELSDKILQDNPEQLIIIVSANENTKELITLINMGVNFFIQKPLNNNTVFKVLIKACKMLNSERKIAQKNQELKELNLVLEEKVIDQNLNLYKKINFDNLTGLPKRNKLIDDIHNLHPYGLMVVKINYFKNINSVYGDEIGDKVISSFADYLKIVAYERDCNLYYLGGVEFVFLKMSVKEEGYCKKTANIIIEKVENEGIDVSLDDEKLNILLNVTIGMSKSNYNLLANAQLALKMAKEKKVRFLLFNPELKLEKASSDTIVTTKLIKNAIEDDKVIPFFQPITTKEGKVKYESLIRIEDEYGDIISPFFFLETAKKIRYYEKLTRIMIEKVFKKFQFRDEDFSINLSFEDIINEDTEKFLCECIEKYNVSNRLVVEILESESIEDFEVVLKFINKVRALGVKIALDDFGSGYSNFSYLLEIKPDFIKIDGSIIKNIDKDENSFIIAQTIVEFSKKMGAKTIAEYIHSKEVYDKVLELGIDGYQGYYISEPKKEI